MKIAVVTANLGNFDKMVDPVPQSINYDFYRFTDKNFLPRHCSMTPRLQARIPKMFGWQMAPGYEYYIWVDSSYTLSHPDTVKWLVEQCENLELVVFQHPKRNTIQEEADHILERLKMGCEYITPRYENELVHEQLKVIYADTSFFDNQLFASTVFVYYNNERMREMLTQWWYHTSRFHTVDQLAFPYVIFKSKCNYRVVEVDRKYNFLHVPYLRRVR